MDKYKKLNYYFSTLILVIVLLSYFLSIQFCKDYECYYKYEVSLLEPLIFGGSIFFLISSGLLFLPSIYFKNWLKYIVSWYLPSSVYFISQISIYSSNILSIDRGPAAIWLMSILGVITIVFVLVSKKERHKVANWS